MLKGHVFKEQIFESQVFAYFVDTFLNKQCGIGDYGSNMEIVYSGNNVTIQDGLACIRGRFIEEDTQTTIDVGSDNNFCKLVIEINLDKENTEEVLMQASYKVIKNDNSYPDLIQTDIVKNNAGIYQYELVRFKTGVNGITDFQDMRTFIDLNSIFMMMKNEFNVFLEELKTKIQNVEDGSAYMLKSNIAILKGVTPSSDRVDIPYPEGFSFENTVVIGLKIKVDFSSSWNTRTSACELFLCPNTMELLKLEGFTNQKCNYEIALMKI